MTSREPDQKTRHVVPPLGWPIRLRAVIVLAADRPRLITWNRYPRQCIGFAVRLRGNRQLSLLWAKPARWWTA